MRDDLKKYKQTYYAIGHIKCSALNNEKVLFNNNGLNHLLRKHGRLRATCEQKKRLGLLRYAEKILQDNTASVQYRKEIKGRNETKFGSFKEY